jgi:hypothetical protein
MKKLVSKVKCLLARVMVALKLKKVEECKAPALKKTPKKVVKKKK